MMKRCLAAAAVVALMAGAAMAQAPSYSANKSYGFISSPNNPHNFSSQGWSNNQICKPCHTPHNAVNGAGVSDRLWAHRLSSQTYQTSYGALANNVALDNVSRLCMGCHDGTLAPGDYSYNTNGQQGSLGSDKLIGFVGAGQQGDLTNQHPVGYTANYPNLSRMKAPTVTANSDGTYSVAVKSSPVTVNGASWQASLGLAYMAVVPNPNTSGTTYGYVVGCKTCHNPHGTQQGSSSTFSTVGADPLPHLLVMDNTGSALCLTCHNK